MVLSTVHDGGGEQTNQSTVTFSEISLGSPDAKNFETAAFFVPSFTVMDKVNRQRYRLNAEGKKVDVVFDEFAPVEIIPKARYEASAPTPMQDNSWFSWLLGGSVVAIAAGLALYLFDGHFRNAGTGT